MERGTASVSIPHAVGRLTCQAAPPPPKSKSWNMRAMFAQADDTQSLDSEIFGQLASDRGCCYSLTSSLSDADQPSLVSLAQFFDDQVDQRSYTGGYDHDSSMNDV